MAPFLLIFLGILALLIVNLLIALVEGVILTLLSWNAFRPSMTVSAIMNITSGIVNGILLIVLQRIPLLWIPVSFLLSLLIEGLILGYFKRNATRQNITAIILINLASYALLVLPAYYFGTRTT